jgi:polyferredoxin
MLGMLFYILASRTDFEVRVLQIRQPLYTVLSDDSVRNRYEIHLVNKTLEDHQYLIQTDGIPAEALDMGTFDNPVSIPSGKDLRIRVKVDLDEERAKHTKGFDFLIVPQSAPEQREVRHVSFDSKK